MPDDRLQWLISVDDHLVEPPNVWIDRVTKRDRERVPHVVHVDGTMYWSYEGKLTPVPGIIVSAGRDPAEVDPRPVTYEQMRPAHYDVHARVRDMDDDHVLASLCFPTVPRFCGQAFLEANDRRMALTCLRAYNDWMLDDWAGAAPGRFIPLMIIPLWDPIEAVREIERCAAKGAKAISFSENPSMLGLPSIHDKDDYWAPVLAAANDCGLPLSIHFGSSSSMPTTSQDAPMLVGATLAPVNLMKCLVDWLFSGQLQKYPDLKLCLAEGGIGWIPYFLERADGQAERKRWAEESDYSWDLAKGGAVVSSGKVTRARLEVPPSQLFRDHIYGCFIDDRFGSQHIDLVGEDNVMIETDFPHEDSTFPNSLESARSLLAHVSDETKFKVLQGNARRLFKLEIEPRVEIDAHVG